MIPSQKKIHCNKTCDEMICSLPSRDGKSEGQEEQTCSAQALTSLDRDQQTKLAADLSALPVPKQKNTTAIPAEVAAAAGNAQASQESESAGNYQSGWTAPLQPREGVLFLLVGKFNRARPKF